VSDSSLLSTFGGWSALLTRISNGGDLTSGEAEAVMNEILSAAATPAQMGAFMMGLASKGETPAEITGLVRSLLTHAAPLAVSGDVLDIVGTGGDRLRSINVSTLASLIAAGAGARVCKHGNRAVTSSVGTADVLEALGVVVELDGEGVAHCINESGMGFAFAPRFHPALRVAAPIRKELGFPTFFNILGPLANPAHARFQLLGVADATKAETMAWVLLANGTERAWVVYADDGLDELSICGPSTVLVVDATAKSAVTTMRIDPQELGISPAVIEDLRGGDAAFNAAVIRNVLDGQKGPARDIGVLNAAGALVVTGHASDIAEGMKQASTAVDDGRARQVLERLIAASKSAA